MNTRFWVGYILYIPVLIAAEMPLSQQFKLGVASADVSSNSAILWTYYQGNYPLKLCIWTKGAKAIWKEVQPGENGYVQEEVQGLNPYTRYAYAFSEIGPGSKPIAQSEVGYFRTALAQNDLFSLKIGAVSCIKYWFEPVVLADAAQNNLDFFIFNGDNSYNDGMVSLEEYRGRWAQTLSRKSYQAIRGATSMIATLDDHDIEDNFDPEKINPDQLKAGLQAFFENMPIRHNVSNYNQIWRKLSWGKTLDVFVLDCRTERKKSRELYISREQMEWLKKGLVESKTMFKIIVNSVPITEFSLPMAYDRWQGFPEQRQEILEYIDRNHIENLLWVSGDFHFGSLGRVSSQGAGSRQIEVLAGPGAQISNRVGHWVRMFSQFDWVHVQNNYITIELDVDQKKMLIEPHFIESDPADEEDPYVLYQ